MEIDGLSEFTDCLLGWPAPMAQWLACLAVVVVVLTGPHLTEVDGFFSVRGRLQVGPSVRYEVKSLYRVVHTCNIRGWNWGNWGNHPDSPILDKVFQEISGRGIG